MLKKVLGIIAIIILVVSIAGYLAYNDPPTRFKVAQILGLKKSPQKTGDNINIQEYFIGLHGPTTMAFVGNDIIYLEKNSGLVRFIKDTKLMDEPLHDFQVTDEYESGLLGILVVGSDIYFYVTESDMDGGEPIADNIYKFRWTDEKLDNQQLIKSLPAFATWHHGGVMALGLDGTVYAVRGDQRDVFGDVEYGVLQNSLSGNPDDTSIILLVNKGNDITPSKSAVPFEYYYAIGIRNSFGLAIDPQTGNLWDTENGEDTYDEINLVLPKFNSGWKKIMGFANSTQILELSTIRDFMYSDPEFSWKNSVAPTAILFADERLPHKFQNTVFVADCNGNIYNFKLDAERTGFIFNNVDLMDKVADPDDDLSEIIFAKDLGCISDLKISPSGSIFVISHANNGVMYKITFD